MKHLKSVSIFIISASNKKGVWIKHPKVSQILPLWSPNSRPGGEGDWGPQREYLRDRGVFDSKEDDFPQQEEEKICFL